MRGYFITFEGGEGAGKTSLIKSISDYLTESGYDVIVTREPGGIDIAEQIRDIVLNTNNTKMDELTEAYLFAASRRQHLVERVIPEVKKGKVVLCDRFIDSSIVYQGYARGIGMDKVYEINKVVVDGFMPDLTLFVDVLPEVGLKRKQDNSCKVNRLDLEGNNFHNLVYKGYHILAKKFNDRIKVINGEQSMDKVKEDSIKLLEELLNGSR